MLMALDRLHAENEVTRPETSKFSRASNRSIYNTTLSNFHASNMNTNGIQIKKKKTIKNDGQSTFYNIKYSKTKTDNFRMVTPHDYTHDIQHSSQQQQQQCHHYYPHYQYHHPKALGLGIGLIAHMNNNNSQKEQILPIIKQNTNEQQGINGIASSSQGFQVHNADLKNGITLDKVFGSGFKKIDIFDANLKEFENHEFYMNRINGEKDKEISELHEAYSYESFEILESENEEDPNADGYMIQNHGNNHGEQTRVSFANSELEGIRDRINKKYKNKHTSLKYKKNGQRLSKSKSPEGPNNEEMKIMNLECHTLNEQIKLPQNQQEKCQIQNSPKYTDNDERKNGRIIKQENSNKFESKSLSPKCLQEMRKSRFQTTGTSFLEKSKVVSPEGQTHTGSKSNFFPGNINLMNLTHESNFRNSKAFKTRADGFSIDERATNKARNIDEIKKPRGSSLNTDKLSEKSLKFIIEKTDAAAYIENKYIKDNQLIVERLKQEEKNMIDKYAKKFNLYPSEIQNFSKDERIARSSHQQQKKRLSTPMKDFEPSAMIHRKKQPEQI